MSPGVHRRPAGRRDVSLPVSKNSECQVLHTLDYRNDFPLRREHLVAWRIGWGRKSDALAERAQVLNLGLDSFIFLDDGPVECALVRADLPQVLTLRVPRDDGVLEYLLHAWAFDRLKVTQEDRARTRMYRENVERSRLQRQAPRVSCTR